MADLIVCCKLKSQFKLEEDENEEEAEPGTSCNIYIIFQCLLSIVLNLDTFCHIAFIAALVQTTVLGIYKTTPELIGVLMLLGLTIFALYSGNHRRTMCLKRSWFLDPEVHKLIPYTYRNQ